MTKYQLDQTVWFLRYGHGDITSGAVVAISDGDTFNKAKVVVRHGMDFSVVECDGRFLFGSYQEACLSKAQDRQSDAARALAEAADLFKRAGLATKKDA